VDDTGVLEGLIKTFYQTLSRIAVSMEQDEFHLTQWNLSPSAAWSRLRIATDLLPLSRKLLRKRFSNVQLHPGYSMREYPSEKLAAARKDVSNVPMVLSSLLRNLIEVLKNNNEVLRSRS